MLESKGSVATKLKTALFGLNISLPTWIIKYIKLICLRIVVVFAHETRACKFSTSFNFNFCGKERSFHIVNIPIMVIKPEASVK